MFHREYTSTYHSLSKREWLLRYFKEQGTAGLDYENDSDRSLYADIRRNTNWAILSHSGTYSHQHVDAGGVWTTAIVAQGAKLWSCLDPRRNSGFSDVRNLHFSDAFDMYKIQGDQSWVSILLNAGDVLCVNLLSPHAEPV